VKPIDTRNQFYDVWNVYWPIALAVFLIVLGLVVFLGLRYRSRSREIPRGRDENERLEAAYAIGLACVAAFLIALTFSRMPGNTDAEATGRPLEVKVTGARWNWRFEYPEFWIVRCCASRSTPRSTSKGARSTSSTPSGSPNRSSSATSSPASSTAGRWSSAGSSRTPAAAPAPSSAGSNTGRWSSTSW
jgi:heme/copper-type cytochrome/quinol oxidase subunit 2